MHQERLFWDAKCKISPVLCMGGGVSRLVAWLTSQFSLPAIFATIIKEYTCIINTHKNHRKYASGSLFWDAKCKIFPALGGGCPPPRPSSRSGASRPRNWLFQGPLKWNSNPPEKILVTGLYSRPMLSTTKASLFFWVTPPLCISASLFSSSSCNLLIFCHTL